jgi:hypothetical protein
MTDGTWQSYALADGARAHFKITESDGRFVVTELYVHGAALTAATLRAVPISRIEAMANSGQGYLQHLRARHAKKAQPTTFEDLRDTAVSPVHVTSEKSQDSGSSTAKRQPLERPDRSDPEAFYRRVADAYQDVIGKTSLSGQTPKVAKVLAEEAGVPVTTVHRWILESRRRGFLPPARQGRAG